jgi:tripartite-type tricarboxylate transporter receptor subunit TctC
MRLVLLLLVAVAYAVPLPAPAQSSPSKTIRIVLAFPPGGTVDALARPLAERLSAMLGQPVVVENKPGAQTVIAGEIVAKAPPDGYTLYVMSGSHVLTPFLMKKVPYDAVADFTPITMFGTQGYVFIANAAQPFSTLKEMVSYAKANPGALSMGVSDATTLAVAQQLRTQEGIDITTIPYKGGGQQIGDLIGGQLPVGVGTPPVYTPYVKEPRVRGLGVSVAQRMPFLPDVPTVDEALGKPGFDVQTWYAFAGPANLPRPIVERLNRAVTTIAAEPEMRKLIANLGIVAPADTSPEAAAALMKSYQPRMGKLLQAAGVKPE